MRCIVLRGPYRIVVYYILVIDSFDLDSNFLSLTKDGSMG